jgi:hypothetical protein
MGGQLNASSATTTRPARGITGIIETQVSVPWSRITAEMDFGAAA